MVKNKEILKKFLLANWGGMSIKALRPIDNKRGFLRVLEVIIASLLVLSSVLIVVTNRDVGRSTDFCSEIPDIVEEISKDKIIRASILEERENSGDIDNFINVRISNPLLSHEFKICEAGEICRLTKIIGSDTEVCAAERIISVDVGSNDFKPKKIKLFVFEG
jgi:hypothetical protein